MAYRPPNISQSIACKIVQPAILAISQIKHGEIRDQAIGVLSTQTAIAALARSMGLQAPPECEPLNKMCRELNRALRDQAGVAVDHEEVLVCERWLDMLREQLGRAKKQELVELVDRLVIAAGVAR